MEPHYDLNVILLPHLGEQQLQAEKDAIQSQVERTGGEILSLDEWGLRRMAYPIQKLIEGHYLIYRTNLSGNAPRAIETALRQRDNVMRVLIVKDRPEWHTRKEQPKAEEPAEATEEAAS